MTKIRLFLCNEKSIYMNSMRLEHKYIDYLVQ